MFLHKLRDYFMPRPIVAAPELHRFLSGEAAYLAQRATYEFTRNTLAWFGQSAFAEKAFNVAFAKCRWEAFAAILADMLVLTRSHVDSAGADPGRLDDALLALYRDMLHEYPRPQHRPDGWQDVVDRLAQRLRLINADSTRDARDVALHASKAVFDSLPVYSHDRNENLRVITNAITFGMISFADRMRVRLRPAELAAALGKPR